MRYDCFSDKYLTIKPHHFLDFLYDLGSNFIYEGENVYGNNNALLSEMFKRGCFKNIKFTPGVDDICKPCKNLKNGYCLDVFDEETTKKYNTNSKHEFNYALDIRLNKELPDIFIFDKVQSLYDVLIKLIASLTKEIISLYLWERPNRVEMTFIGIENALQQIKKQDQLN